MATPEQLNEWREAFQLFDKDGDGFIATSELGTVMRAVGASPTQAQVAEMIKAADPSGTKMISFDKFAELVAESIKNNKDTEEDIVEAFRVFDKDGKGFISVQELRHTMTTLGEKMTESEVDEMLRLAGVPAEGQIKYAEFARKLAA